MKTQRGSEVEIALRHCKSPCRWLTSFSRASAANLSARDSTGATSAARESIRNGSCFLASPHISKWLRPSSVQNSSVRALYAAFNFANPCLRSSSSTRGIENIRYTSRGCCYHQAGVCVSSEPALAAALCQAGRESDLKQMTQCETGWGLTDPVTNQSKCVTVWRALGLRLGGVEMASREL